MNEPRRALRIDDEATAARMRPSASFVGPSVVTRSRMMIDRFLGHWSRHEKLRFIVVGGWNTLFGYLTFLILYTVLRERLNYLVIAVLAHAIAVVNAFACHRVLVFKSRRSWTAEFVRFNVAQLAVLASGLVGLWLLVSVLHFNPLVAQALITIATVLFSYVAHRRFSFSAP